MDFIIGLPGFRVKNISNDHFITFEVSFEEPMLCPHCSSQHLRKKDSFTRFIRHQSLGTKRTLLEIKAHKFLCLTCRRYFNSRFPGILPFKRSSELLVDEIFQKHISGISQATLSEQVGLGSATIERLVHKRLEHKMSHLKNRHCPKILGIDEHFFTRKKGYATTLVDLQKSKVFDVTLGRSENALKHYLETLKGKSNVKVILMDMSSTYRSIAKKYFPQALIVTDRFHVIRLINHCFLKTWAKFDPQGKKHRGLLSLMRRHHWNLSPEQQKNLQSYLDKYPTLKEIYFFKQRLNHLMIQKHKTKKTVFPLIKEFLQMISELMDTSIEELLTLGNTLNSWKDEIARMWRFTKTNSTTEGLHNKMEVISRRAYGFKNFQNYRIRVIILCS